MKCIPTTAKALVNFHCLQSDTIQSVIDRVPKAMDDKRVTMTDNSVSINPFSITGTGAECKMIEKTGYQTWRDKKT